MTLSKSAEVLQKSLFEKGLTFEVAELATRTRTANDAATRIGKSLSNTIKCSVTKHFFSL